MCLEIPLVASDLLAAYQQLLPVPLHGCLLGEDPENRSERRIIAVGATLRGEPIGLALASCSKMHRALMPLDRVVDIHSVFVQLEHRQQHIGRCLLAKLQEEVKKLVPRGYQQIFSLVYEQDDPSLPALKKLLEANAWQGVRPFLIRCIYNVFNFDMPWVHVDYRYPPGFEEFRWTELTPSERRQIESQKQQHHFSGVMFPFSEEKIIEPINSLGLRYKGEVMGWMITHRIAPDTIRYSIFYIARRWRLHGVASKLVFDSIRLHLASRTQWAILEIPLIQVDVSWMRFVEKRLVPYADKVIRLMQAWTAL